AILGQIDQILQADFDGDIILVSNELGLGLVPVYALSRAFRDIAGRVNQKVAAAADEFYFLISGIPMRLK
ncbi:MAG: bifunctional adenosylcobinamide kinase/adenosylcobinamide-phosphate guanylyltransferase, partial [Clostridiales bacterium]